MNKFQKKKQTSKLPGSKLERLRKFTYCYDWKVIRAGKNTPLEANNWPGWRRIKNGKS